MRKLDLGLLVNVLIMHELLGAGHAVHTVCIATFSTKILIFPSACESFLPQKFSPLKVFHYMYMLLVISTYRGPSAACGTRSSLQKVANKYSAFELSNKKSGCV